MIAVEIPGLAGTSASTSWRASGASAAAGRGGSMPLALGGSVTGWVSLDEAGIGGGDEIEAAGYFWRLTGTDGDAMSNKV